jgi:hypothetical protein
MLARWCIHLSSDGVPSAASRRGNPGAVCNRLARLPVRLPRVLKSCMAIGVEYGIWGAFGVALTAVMAAVLLG